MAFHAVFSQDSRDGATLIQLHLQDGHALAMPRFQFSIASTISLFYRVSIRPFYLLVGCYRLFQFEWTVPSLWSRLPPQLGERFLNDRYDRCAMRNLRT
jgi:hypothetical protein